MKVLIDVVEKMASCPLLLKLHTEHCVDPLTWQWWSTSHTQRCPHDGEPCAANPFPAPSLQVRRSSDADKAENFEEVEKWLKALSSLHRAFCLLRWLHPVGGELVYVITSLCLLLENIERKGTLLAVWRHFFSSRLEDREAKIGITAQWCLHISHNKYRDLGLKP